MSLSEISLPTATPFYRMRVTLDGTDYLIDVAWAGRQAAWFLSLYAADETPLALSIKVVSGIPLLAWFNGTDGMPPGDLFAVDITEKNYPIPGYDDLGSTVPLVYADASEFA